MRFVLMIPLLLVGLLLLSGCKKTHAKIEEERVKQMEKMVEVLKGVKDEASAKAAASDLKAIKDKMIDLDAEYKKLPEPTTEEMKAVTEIRKKGVEKMGALFSEMMRIQSDPKLSAILKDVVK